MLADELCPKCGAPGRDCNAIGECQTRVVTPAKLAIAWERYVATFGVLPHGTVKQFAALLELIPRSQSAEVEESDGMQTYRRLKEQHARRPEANRV
jgi:hypothetical protein